jgi:hypothetical protein
VFDDSENGLHRPTVVHVDLVLTGPMEGLPVFHPLQPLEANAVFLEQGEILGWKVAPNDPHQSGGREEAGSHRRMACGTAQQAGIFRLGSLDGI